MPVDLCCVFTVQEEVGCRGAITAANRVRPGLGIALEGTTAADLAKLCAERLGAHPQFVEAGRPVTRLAEVSGGGGSYLQEAIDLGADCFVTGEAAHHIALLAHQMGVGLVVAGHWATEYPVTRVLAEHLAAALPDEARITLSLADQDPFTYL